MSSDTPAVRASDAEREQAVVTLRDAAAEGRLTLEEFAGRMERAYEARTRTELDELRADLPAPSVAAEPERSKKGRTKRRFVAIMSSTAQRGRWRLAEGASGLCVMGDLTLDLRSALLSAPEVSVRIVTVMGNTSVIVPKGVTVELAGVNVMGNKEDLTCAAAVPDAPSVHISGWVVMGNLQVFDS